MKIKKLKEDYAEKYPQWFMKMDEREDIDHTMLSKSEKNLLMDIYANGMEKYSYPWEKSLLNTFDSLVAKGYLVRKPGRDVKLSPKGEQMFEDFFPADNANGVVGARAKYFPKTVDVIQDTELDVDTNTLVTTYRLLVSFSNGMAEIQPPVAEPGAVDADGLIDILYGSEFFNDYYLPAILNSFGVTELSENSKDPLLNKIADVVKGKKLVDIRPDLEKIFKKQDINFSFSPYAHYSIRSQGKSITIINKKYVDIDDSVVVVDDIAIGY